MGCSVRVGIYGLSAKVYNWFIKFRKKAKPINL